MRVYIFLRIFRDQSLSRGGAKLVAQLSQTDLDLAFIIKTTLYKDPFPLSLGSLGICFFICAFCMYVAERGRGIMISVEGRGPGNAGMSFQDAIWLTSVTYTTVGYGTVTPDTTTGRIVAVLSAVIGIIFTALITAIIHRTLTISKTQKQMVLFMLECGQAINMKEYASRIISQAFRVRKLGSMAAPKVHWRNLNRLCQRFRSLRRREGAM